MAAANRDLVVIGGSAGAGTPLRTVLTALPEDLPAAVLVVMHFPSGSEGLLPTLSSPASPIRLPVENASDGAELRSGRVYLAPPDRHLLVIDGRLKLGTGPRENLVRPAIDPLFRSAALSHGPRAIGMILSGRLNDGASGLAAIKRCGGVALVQAPSDAEARDMPIAALEATPVDLSAPRDKLAEGLLRFVAEVPAKAGESPNDIRFEVEVAAGGRIDHERLGDIAETVSMSCPDCGGVLSEIKVPGPLRFRCQVGHGFTGKVLLDRQEGLVDEAIRVALRIIEERVALVSRMGRDAGQAGRSSMSEMYEKRAGEYQEHAEILREAILRSMARGDRVDADESVTKAELQRTIPQDDMI
jgi:two-component system chemotaxis response regulator CheB